MVRLFVISEKQAYMLSGVSPTKLGACFFSFGPCSALLASVAGGGGRTWGGRCWVWRIGGCGLWGGRCWSWMISGCGLWRGRRWSWRTGDCAPRLGSLRLHRIGSGRWPSWRVSFVTGGPAAGSNVTPPVGWNFAVTYTGRRSVSDPSSTFISGERLRLGSCCRPSVRFCDLRLFEGAGARGVKAGGPGAGRAGARGV
jgi:hypothetical protein